MRFISILAATTALLAAVPASAQAQDGPGTPAFRVPISDGASGSTSAPVHAWLKTTGTCSAVCGTGTRTTSYQCQDVSSYDFGGSGYGAPEADSFCSATSAKPADESVSCTNYSGCGYDWVKPAVIVTRVAKENPDGGTFPVGAADDCSRARRSFFPYCQRTGTPNVTMASGDYAFCRNDRPDYNDVASGNPDALGYDRTADVETGCIAGARDQQWTSSAWTSSSSTCSSAPTQTRTVQCVRKFNGANQSDAACAGIAKPATTQTVAADYTSCSYAWNAGSWGSYAAACSNSTTRNRIVTCRRSDGADVADSSCSNAGPKPATTESGSSFDANTCPPPYTWSWNAGAWSGYNSGCSSSATRTRNVSCMRSDGVVDADQKCDAGSRPPSSETTAVYSSCSYTSSRVSQSSCSGGQRTVQMQCNRADGVQVSNSQCGTADTTTEACSMPATQGQYCDGGTLIGQSSNGQYSSYAGGRPNWSTDGGWGSSNDSRINCVQQTIITNTEYGQNESRDETFSYYIGSVGTTGQVYYYGDTNGSRYEQADYNGRP